jgi:hypothetical protein
VGTDNKCGGCLWYGAPDHANKPGQCENAESPVYWNRGDDREAVQITPDTKSCMHYRSASAFLGESNGTRRRWGGGFVSLVRTGLFQLTYPLLLTGLFFYCVFFRSPKRYDAGYARAQIERLSL